MPSRSPANPKRKSLKLWQCVYIMLEDGRYAGYINKLPPFFGEKYGSKKKVELTKCTCRSLDTGEIKI